MSLDSILHSPSLTLGCNSLRSVALANARVSFVANAPQSMNSNTTRLILELVIHHGNLSVPDLRLLSLASLAWKEMLEIVKGALQDRKLYHKNEKTSYTYYLFQGIEIKHGTCVLNKMCDYDATFLVKKSGKYVDGEREGVFEKVSKYEHRTSMYINDKLNGEHRVFDSITDAPALLEHYENGVQHGFFRAWMDGIAHYEGTEIGGDSEGIHKSFSVRSGLLNQEDVFKNGEQHGTCRSWYSTGQLESVTNWWEGNLVSFTAWHPTGHLCKQRSYLNGELHGESYEFDEEGKIMSKEEYVNGSSLSLESDRP